MKLTKLTPSARVKGRWLCHLEDGSLLRVGEGEVVAFALHSGMELDGETCTALAAAAQRSELREKALNLLAARPLSRRDLIKKLLEREAESQQAEEIADWLEELGYLDDGAYARRVAEHYAAKGYGERKIRDELYRRGVPRDCWACAVADAEGPETGIDAFLRSKLKGEAPDPKTLKRVTDALARRGHRWEDIKAGLRRYGAEIEEE